MIKNPFKSLKKHDYLLWGISLSVVIISNLVTESTSPLFLTGTAIGITALIFIAKGDVTGQILTVVFSIFYAIGSYSFRYYGEMITYLGMTMPIALLSVISWLKNPYEKGKNEVKIHRLKPRQLICIILLTALVTWVFYYILRAFNTANLFFSTVSVATSFLASALMLFRNPYYALAYCANDIVLIILWILAAYENFAYFPMVICFVMFFINDVYGFVSWKLREKKQKGM